MDRKKIQYLVVDTGAFLKNASIPELAENVITCQEVVDEVTNHRQLRRLVVLPYELQIKDVFPENVKFVTEFSKKTGDYPSLSATDIKVIALTYQLEKEKVGSEHLKVMPEAQRTITFQNRPTVDPKDVVGFYIPSGQHSAGDEIDDSSTVAAPVNSTTSDRSHPEVLDSNCETIDDLKCSEISEDDSEEEHTAESDVDEDKEEVDPSTVLVRVQELSLDCNNSNTDEGSDSYQGDSGDSDNEDDSDGGGWITPDNIALAKKKMNAEFEEEKEVTVACITTDFAMQNVLKQIGLHVSSVDGRVIKQLRTFILRCYACFKTTSIMTKAFCPHCGHKTLKRVAVSVEPDGSQKIHINIKKPLTARGKKFSMPTFQGGKHANNPIIFADQPVPDQRPTRMARIKTNILDADYIPGYSPFAMRDTTSRSAMMGIRGQQEVKYWMRRNPNEVKPHSGNKKKKKK